MAGRRSTTEIGRAGEDAAAAFLLEQGYRILARNLRYRFGEIDIVAEESGVLVFVEVKTRRGESFGTPAEAVTYRKQLQLSRLAGLYLAESGRASHLARFDVVTVQPAPLGGWRCELLANAFPARHG